MNSSIFNSRFLNPVMVRIYICFVLSLLIAYSILWNLNKRKVNFFEGFFPTQARSISPETENMIIGNSTCANGLLDKDFLPNSENFSIGDGDFVVANLMLKNALSKNGNLKKLIICYDNLMFFVDCVARRNGDHRKFIANGVEWFQVPGISFGQKLKFAIKYNWPILSYFFMGKKLSSENLIKLVEDRPIIKKSPFHYKVDQGKGKISGYSNAHKKKNNQKKNVSAFKEIITLAKQRKLELFFVRMPFTKEFAEYRDDWWNEQHAKFKALAIKELNGAQFNYIDLSAAPFLDHKYFNDPNHLNKEGALKNTLNLRTIIQKISQGQETNSQI